MNPPQENLGIPIDIQNIIHPVIIQGLVKDIKKVENFIQGMETMYIPPHIEAEDTTVQLFPAAVLLQMNRQIQIQSILQMSNFYSSGSSSDDRYFSPARHCHQPYRRPVSP